MNPNRERQKMSDPEELLRALRDRDEPAEAQSGAVELREEPLMPQERAAALGAARSAVVDGRLEAAGRRIGPPDPTEELGPYLERVRSAAGVSIERWAVRLGVPSEVLERVFTTRRGVLSLRPEGWATVLDAVNLRVEVLRRAVSGAAGLLGGSAARSAGGADPRLEASVRQFMEQVESALRDQDREDLIG